MTIPSQTRIKLATVGALFFSACAALGQAPFTLRAMREIDDPSSGLRWYLVTDPTHPGAPGRLAPSTGGAGSAASVLIEPPLRPIVLAGDRLVVEDYTPVLKVWLEAVALGPARQGEVVKARCAGHLVRVEIVGSGRARLLGAGESGR
ncbi:MAG TPA: hypothetical protein VL967_11430 [Terracidiphilus sp.]|nr:hypothetical protein [Terracidiphilus sp.]